MMTAHRHMCIIICGRSIYFNKQIFICRGERVESMMNYVRPELVVVSLVLYFIGMGLKHAQAVKDKYIPLILGGAGIVICALYVFAARPGGGAQNLVMAVFTSVTQGILTAGLSTYVNQVIKQMKKEE